MPKNLCGFRGDSFAGRCVARSTRGGPTAFTLIELLVVIAIIGVLTATVLPVILQARGRAAQTSCLSNMRQLGMAMLTYTQDFDEQTPTGRLFPFLGTSPINTGWAGRVYPYAKSTDVFHCPADGTVANVTPSGSPVPLYSVSYGMNRNFASASSVVTATAPARTVLLFEVAKSQVQLTLPDEGQSSLPVPAQISAVGNGVENSMLGWTKRTPASSDDYVELDTGPMDNSRHDPNVYDNYMGRKGRHNYGANFLALDGHVIWLNGSRVSSGFNAHAATDPQSESGCVFIGDGRGLSPCAEGVENTGTTRHNLTFSVR